MTRRIGLQSARRILRRQVTDGDQVAVHFTGDLSLLFRGTGDDQIAFVDLADGSKDVFQYRAGGLLARRRPRLPG
ncbi:hypothetical protein [Xanthomonas arboricola]|uniref:hypothetical protein n=1 Tax=Xanthomonas arboricola TaxID=56448 RepID=UPI0015587B06|nr:hypothetical protein [Xanthomonas arboricola]